MKFLRNIFAKEPVLIAVIVLLLLTSILSLRSIAPAIFPTYYLYFILAIAAFLIFANIGFDILSVFSKQLYIASLLFLILPLVIGQVTRGTVRWIPLGPLTLQPSELVRPFLLLFFANFLSERDVTLKRFFQSALIVSPALFLILVQPSLGVTVLTALAYLGAVLASNFNKKMLILFFVVGVIISPLIWISLADYQKSRVLTFLYPARDPTGAGYNSMQAMISVGSGRLWGRGLGEGVQTQLSFLPERHTDFIFASIAEEMGFIGAVFLLLALFVLLYRIIKALYEAQGIAARGFISGIFLTVFSQTVIHVGMNMGMLPITGVPLPLVSAGGSSLLATMISMGMVIGALKSRR